MVADSATEMSSALQLTPALLAAMIARVVPMCILVAVLAVSVVRKVLPMVQQLCSYRYYQL
jgi:hypothetical protein